jgi:hypothetical protein
MTANSKFEAPNSKQARSTKFETARIPPAAFRVWVFEFVSDLVLRISNLIFLFGASYFEFPSNTKGCPIQGSAA